MFNSHEFLNKCIKTSTHKRIIKQLACLYIICVTQFLKKKQFKKQLSLKTVNSKIL